MSVAVLRFPRLVPRCDHCGWLVPPSSATESLHRERCIEPRERAARLTEARSRKSRGVPIPKPDAPRPHKAARERLTRLRCALDDQMMHPALMALTGLPVEALERVAAGRSTMSSSAWRRIMAELGR